MSKTRWTRIESSMRYYVYALSLSEDGDHVFYVGKGTNQRANQHVQDAVNGELSPKCAVIRHVRRQGLDCWYHILFETDDEQHAYWHEMNAITSYPYGSLCNVMGGSISPIKVVLNPPRGLVIDWEGELYRRESDGRTTLIADMMGTREKVLRTLHPIYDAEVLPTYLSRLGIGTEKQDG